MAPSTRPTDKPMARPTSPQATLFPPLEIEEYPNVDLGTLQETQISNPDNNSNSARPAANTRYQRKVCTITQDSLFHLMESPFLPHQFTSRQASTRKYPLQFLCDFAFSILDDKTGDLLEYRHLLKHPKYKDVWSQSFGKEIWRLATATETIAFLTKQADRAYDMEISPRLFVISFVILLYAISYNICI